MEVDWKMGWAGVEAGARFGVGLGQEILVRSLFQVGEASLENVVGAVGVLQVVDGEVDHFEPRADFVGKGGGDFFVFGEGFFQLAFGAAGLGWAHRASP